MSNQNSKKEFVYSQKDFDAVRKRLYQVSGIKLGDSKDSMVYSRLARRLRALKIQSFDAYLKYINAHPAERTEFVNALTTNLTSFFREPHHFRILSDYVLKHRGELKIWCAASSTGEEPYSIAMTVAETLGGFNHPVEIIASDIDSNVLKTAAEGIYKYERVRDLSPRHLKQFFFRGVGSNSGLVKVVPELRAMIHYKNINLTDKVWDIGNDIDIIFCRNVMIYFDKPTQLVILKKMIDRMNPQGIYVAGHSENFAGASDLVKALGNTVYQPVAQ